MSVASKARTAAMPVECKKDALQQKQDGTWKLVLTIAPDGLPDAMMKARPGTRYQCAFVEIGDDEEPVGKPTWEQLSRAQQAGILCSDDSFREWFGEGFYASVEDHIRSYCGVTSRADLDNTGGSQNAWDSLVADWRTRHDTAPSDNGDG